MQNKIKKKPTTLQPQRQASKNQQHYNHKDRQAKANNITTTKIGKKTTTLQPQRQANKKTTTTQTHHKDQKVQNKYKNTKNTTKRSITTIAEHKYKTKIKSSTTHRDQI